jgi:hypothetical protein
MGSETACLAERFWKLGSVHVEFDLTMQRSARLGCRTALSKLRAGMTARRRQAGPPLDRAVDALLPFN